MKRSILFLGFFLPVLAFAQYTGRVVNERNEGVPYASVVVKNTTNGTTADSVGYFTLPAIQKFPFAAAPALIYLLMKKQLDRSRYYRMFRAKEIIIHPVHALEAHLDGEPVLLEGDVRVEVIPKALNVIVP